MSDTPANPPEGGERNRFSDSTLPEGREPTTQQQGDALEFNDSSPEDSNPPTTQPDHESSVPMGSQPTKEANGEEVRTTSAEESDSEDARSQSEEESHEQENHENDEDQEVRDDNTQIKPRNARNARNARSRQHNVDDDFFSTDRRYMVPIALGLINRFFHEQDADRRAARASAAEQNDWESAASVSEDTSQSQDPEENREDGEMEEGGASEQEENQEEENLHDWEEDSGGNQNRDNQDEEENEGNQDDGENRDDAEEAESSTDNSSVNSGASSSSQVPVEGQVLPEIEEAISDSDSGSSSISVPENLPSFPTSSPTPGSPGPTPHLVAPDQVSSSASQVNTPALSSTQVIPDNDDSSLVALANLLGAIIDPESLPLPFGPRAADSDSAAASSSAPTSNQIDDPSFLDNSLGVKTQFEPSTSRAELEIEERGENNELEGGLVSEEDQEHGSISAPQFSSDDAPELVSGLSANVPTTPLSSSAALLPFDSSQSSTPNQAEPSSLLGFIPQTLRNLIANTEQPSSTSPSSIPLPAGSPATPCAATPTPPNPTLWHEAPPSNIPTNVSAVPSPCSDLWSLTSPSNLRHTPFTSSPLVNPWAPLPATNPIQASAPLTLSASAPTSSSLRNIPSISAGDILSDTVASIVQQTTPADGLPPTSPGDTTAPQQEISSGDSSAFFTPSSSSKYDPPPPPPPSETSLITFDTPPAIDGNSGWVPYPNRFRVNRRRCPMCVRRARSFQHGCHGGPPCDACATLGYSAEQCRTGEVGKE